VYTAAEIMEVFPKTAAKEMAKARERMAQAEADKPAQATAVLESYCACTVLYDPTGRSIPPAQASAVPTTFTYDGNGSRNALLDPCYGLVTYCYDPMGRTIKAVDPGESISTLPYSAATTFMHAVDSHHLDPIYGPVTHCFDSLGRVIDPVNLNSTPTTFAYAPDARFAPVDPIYGPMTYCYDPQSRPFGSVNLNSTRTTFSYNG
jgi:hypothetical protein